MGRASIENLFDARCYREVVDQALLETIRSPGDKFLWKAWGSASWLLGDTSGAIKGLTRSLIVNPLDQDACVNLGVAFHGTGRTVAAIDSYYRALILGIDAPSAYYNFAVTLSGLHDGNASLQHFLRCAQLDPGNAQTWSSLASVYKAQGFRESAIAAYQKAICALPVAEVALSGLGLIVSSSNQKFSHDLHSRALRLAIDDPIYLCNYAFALTQMNSLSEAVAMLVRAVSVKPDCHSSWMGLAVTMRDLGRPEEALRMISRSLALQPFSAPIIDCRGGILSKMGAVNDGIENHKMAVSLSPELLESLTNLANLSLEIGSVDKAILY